MTNPKGFFDREVKIKTHNQMMAKLAERTGRGGEVQNPSGAPVPPASTAPAALEWQTPVTHGDGSGFMLSTDGRFSIVKEHTSGSFTYRLFLRGPGTLLSSHPSLKAAQEAANGIQ